MRLLETITVPDPGPPVIEQLLSELLGSAYLLVSAVSGVMEQSILSQSVGQRISLAQLKILKFLDITGRQSIGDVAAFLGVSNAAASKSVDRLVRQKYLRRAEASSDRRSMEASLAPAGRKLLDSYEAARAAKLAEVFRGLSATDVRRTTEILQALTRGVVTSSANPEDVCLQCGLYLKKRCLVRDAVRADCSYQRRKNRRPAHNDEPQVEVPAGGRARVGSRGK